MADSPLVYYRMSEQGGSAAYDSSGHGYTGTYGSGLTLGGGTSVSGDPAPIFPGGSESAPTVMTSPANSALGPTGAMSVELWVTVPSSVSGTQYLFTEPIKSGASTFPVSIALVAGSPATFTVQVTTSSGSIAAHPSAVLNAENHVVLTWSGTTLTAYVNGVATSGGTGTAPLTNYASPYTGFTVGGPSNGQTGFAGAIGDVVVYTTALSATRVQAHYNAAISADPTPAPATGYAGTVQADHPVVYYRTNETSGTTAVDSSGHGYSGTYGSSVTLGGTGLVPGDAAPTFPGGTASSATVLRSGTNSALAPTGAFSAELWVNVPSSVSGSQFVFSEPFASGSNPLPIYISLVAGSPPFWELQINTTGGTVAVYANAVMGAKNHVVLTWTGTTLTVYVNGVASDTATGSGTITNYPSTFSGFTVGGPTDAHTGYAGSAGEFALYNTALSAARVQAHYNAGKTSQGTVVWQTGSGTTGEYTLPTTDDGQCSGEGPVISGNNASFTSTRNTLTNYTYDGNTFPGASTCYRNQLNPEDPNTGENWLFTLGTPYTFTFQTVVTFNGNYVYTYPSGGKLAVDIPAIVWQTHSFGGDGNPCDRLVLDNTYVGYVNGITQYGTVSPGGQPVWNFATCDDSDATEYWSPDTLHDGEVDNWQIKITPEIQGTAGGSVAVWRNGTLVYNKPNHVCDGSTTECFWNFGAYTYYYNSSQEPSGWNSAGITVKFNDMTLTTP
ncbi:MAG TPA: LamG domain-containing protein [Candidatus Baltobacteraceae bacterium]|nr:LamG domain-containing protein [Candidatus Baltobacteraceae bacterium]